MIPKDAKCKFKGILFEVYQWKQKLYDGRHVTFEGIRKSGSVQIIATQGDKIILFNEKQPKAGKFISFPGGIINKNETPLHTAKRELLEETGMKAEKIKFLRKTHISSKIEWPTYYYIAKNCRKIKEPEFDGGEKIVPFLVNFEEFLDIILKKEFRNVDFACYLLRLKHDKKKLEEFRKLIFE